MSKTPEMRTEDRLIRLWEVLKMIPVSRSTWWEGVRTGRYPEPVKLGSRLTCWRLADILQLVESGIQPPQNGGTRNLSGSLEIRPRSMACANR